MKHRRLVATSCALLSLLFTVSFTSGLHAAQAAASQDARAGKTATATGVPRLIKFAGTLPDNASVTRAGTVGIQFAIYGERTGGAPLWQETQNVQLDGQGRYAVLLGSGRELPAAIFSHNEARWLGIQVLADAEPEQARVLLVSVPYALKAQDAETLGGRPASAYVSQEVLSEMLGVVPEAGTKGRLDGGQRAKSLDGDTVSTSVAHTVNAIPRFSAPDTLADSMMLELFNQPAMDAFGLSLGFNEDVVRLGDGTGLRKALHVIGGRIKAEGIDVATSLPNAVRVTNNAANGTSFQVNNTNTGASFTTGVFTSVTSSSAVGFQSVVFPPATPSVPGADYTYSMVGVNSNPEGVTVLGWHRYNAGAGDPLPSLTGPVGIFGSVAHNSGTAGIFAYRGTGTGKIFSGLAGTTEVIGMTSAGNITATGTVTATSFSGSGAALTGVVAASATSFAANPSDCAAGQYANAIDASGDLDCDTVDFSQLSGTSTVARTNVDNNFTTSQTVAGAVTANSITLPATADSNTGVITLAGVPFIHSKSIENFPDPMTENTFVGRNAGNFTLHGHNNTGIGSGALRSSSSSTGGIGNTAVGNIALRSTTTGIGNTGIGYAAAWNNTTGSENTAIGGQALAYNTTGNQNAALGVYAAASNITGVRNTALGTFAFSGPAALDDNTAVGFYALSNPAGQRNTALGSLAAGDSLSWNAGSDNTFIGTSTGVGGSITVNNSTAIGANALVNISNAMVLGDSAVNVGIGTSTPAYKLDVGGTIRSSTGGFRFPDGTTQTTAATGSFAANPSDCTPGQYANAIDASGNLGCSAIQANQLPSLSGSYVDLTTAQTVVGEKTFTSSLWGTHGRFSGELYSDNLTLAASSFDGNVFHGSLFWGGEIAMHMPGSSNIFLGKSAGNISPGPNPGDSNIGIGRDALRFYTTGYSNTAVGLWSLRLNTTGWGNTALGFFTSAWSTTGDLNTAVGWAALGGGTTDTSGSYNTAVGASAIQDITTGSKNTALGRNASFFNRTGNNNTSIGYESGMTGTANVPNDFFNANVSGSNNLYLGYRAGPSLDGFNNSVAIGANAVVSASNAMVLGDSAVNVGIGTSSPAYKLDVGGTIRSSTGGFRFPDGTTQTTAATGSLAANPSDCASGQYANAIDASGNLDCDTVDFSQLSGTSTVARTNVNNNFTTSQTVAGAVTANAIVLPETTDINNGTISIAGVPFIHSKSGISCCISDPFPQNTFVGRNAGNFSQSSAFNTGVGTRALVSLTTGEINTAVGSYALASNTAGEGSTAIGAGALGGNTTGGSNTAAGIWALSENQEGHMNTAMGSFAMQSATGSDNVAVGNKSLRGNDGSANTVVGAQAMFLSTAANQNSAVGFQALTNNSLGNQNAAIGYRALYDNFSGSYNIGIGPYSGSISDGSETGNFSGSYNTFLGYQARPNGTGLENSTAIGANAVVSASNAMVLGDSAVNVGIGTSTPAYKLDVAGTIRSSTGGFRFPDGTTQTTAATGSFSANPSDCPSGQYANAIDGSGNLGCSAIQANQLPSLSGSYVDLTTAQTVGGAKTLTSVIAGPAAQFGGTLLANGMLNLEATGVPGGVLHGTIMIGPDVAMHMLGTDNIFLGNDSGPLFEGSSPGASNTAVGAMTLQFLTTGTINTAVGKEALGLNTTGFGNTGLGSQAGRWNQTGVRNTAAGLGALYNNTVSDNTAIGASALIFSQTGAKNTAVGTYASYFNISGSNNTSIGYESGLSGSTIVGVSDSGEKNATGSNNLYLGYRAGPSADGFNNSAAIGANAVVSVSNALVLGDSAVNVGIGTSSPGAKLHVATGDVAITAQSNGVILRATDGANCFRLTVNNAGAVSTAAVACP